MRVEQLMIRQINCCKPEDSLEFNEACMTLASICQPRQRN